MIRFTIRDVMWLTVVVALACAWWFDRRQQALDRSAILWQYTNLLHATGHVSADWERESVRVSRP